MGMTFQAFRGSSGAQIAFTILLATSIGGGRQRGKGWSKSFFLEISILGMEPKNQVNRATRSGVMAISEFSSERAK